MAKRLIAVRRLRTRWVVGCGAAAQSVHGRFSISHTDEVAEKRRRYQPNLTKEERLELQLRLHSSATPPDLRRRIQGILHADEGVSIALIAKAGGVSTNTVYNWLRRFESSRLQSLPLQRATPRAEPPLRSPQSVARRLRRRLTGTPPSSVLATLSGLTLFVGTLKVSGSFLASAAAMLIAALVGTGFHLVLPLDSRPNRRSDLGVAALVGATLLLLGTAVTIVADQRAERDQRQRDAASMNLEERRLAVALIESGTPLDGLNLSHRPFYAISIRDRSIRNANLDDSVLTETDLSGSDLEGSSFRGADLSGALLVGTNLDHANLESEAGACSHTSSEYRCTRLAGVDGGVSWSGHATALTARGARLDYSDISNANLEGAVLIDASLTGVDLTGANLREAVLAGARMEGAILTDADLSHSVLMGARLSGDLSGVDFSGADLSGADLRGASFVGAILIGTNFRGALTDETSLIPGIDTSTLRQQALRTEQEIDLSGQDLRSMNFSGMDFRHVSLVDADLRGSNLSGADLRGCDLSGADLSRADLTGADLAGCTLSGASFRQAILSGADLKSVTAVSVDFDHAQMLGTIMDPSDGWDFHARGAITDAATTIPQVDGLVRIDSRLSDLDLSDANLTGLDLRGAVLDGVVLDRAILDSVRLDDAQIWNSSLRDAQGVFVSASGLTITDSDLTGVSLTDADLFAAGIWSSDMRNADLTGSDLSSSYLEANLAGSDLSHAVLQSTNLESSVLESTTWTGAMSNALTIWPRSFSLPSDMTPIGAATAIDRQLGSPIWLGPDVSTVSVERSVSDLVLATQPHLESLRIRGSDISVRSDGFIGHVDIESSALSGTWFSNADLRGASIRLTDARGLDLSSALLDGAIIELVVVDDSTVLPPTVDTAGRSSGFVNLSSKQVGIDLAGVYLGRRGASPSNNFWCVRCNLVASDLHRAYLYRAVLSGTDLSWAMLRGASLQSSNLASTNLANADMSGADLRDSSLISASLVDASLRGANLSFADLRGADLSGADLTGSNMLYADLTGATVSPPRVFPATSGGSE